MVGEGETVRPRPAEAHDRACDLDGPAHGWFTADLGRVLAALERPEREAVVGSIGPRLASRAQRSAPLPPPTKVPDRALVAIRRPPGPPREAAPSDHLWRGRALLLAVLLGLCLIGLVVQGWPRPAITVPVSLDAAVEVT